MTSNIIIEYITKLKAISAQMGPITTQMEMIKANIPEDKTTIDAGTLQQLNGMVSGFEKQLDELRAEYEKIKAQLREVSLYVGNEFISSERAPEQLQAFCSSFSTIPAAKIEALTQLIEAPITLSFDEEAEIARINSEAAKEINPLKEIQVKNSARIAEIEAALAGEKAALAQERTRLVSILDDLTGERDALNAKTNLAFLEWQDSVLKYNGDLAGYLSNILSKDLSFDADLISRMLDPKAIDDGSLQDIYSNMDPSLVQTIQPFITGGRTFANLKAMGINNVADNDPNRVQTLEAMLSGATLSHKSACAKKRNYDSVKAVIAEAWASMGDKGASVPSLEDVRNATNSSDFNQVALDFNRLFSSQELSVSELEALLERLKTKSGLIKQAIARNIAIAGFDGRISEKQQEIRAIDQKKFPEEGIDGEKTRLMLENARISQSLGSLETKPIAKREAVRERASNERKAIQAERAGLVAQRSTLEAFAKGELTDPEKIRAMFTLISGLDQQTYNETIGRVASQSRVGTAFVDNSFEGIMGTLTQITTDCSESIAANAITAKWESLTSDPAFKATLAQHEALYAKIMKNYHETEPQEKDAVIKAVNELSARIRSKYHLQTYTSLENVPEKAKKEFETELEKLLSSHGLTIDGYYYRDKSDYTIRERSPYLLVNASVKTRAGEHQSNGVERDADMLARNTIEQQIYDRHEAERESIYDQLEELSRNFMFSKFPELKNDHPKEKFHGRRKDSEGKRDASGFGGNYQLYMDFLYKCGFPQSEIEKRGRTKMHTVEDMQLAANINKKAATKNISDAQRTKLSNIINNILGEQIDVSTLTPQEILDIIARLKPALRAMDEIRIEMSEDYLNSLAGLDVSELSATSAAQYLDSQGSKMSM